MRAKIQNFAKHQRRGWVDIAVPQILAGQDQSWVFGKKRFPIARGIDIGTHSTLLHVFCHLKPGEQITGSITPEEWSLPFAATTWVADDVSALVPRPTVIRTLDAMEETSKQFGLGITAMTQVENKAARQVWHQTGRITNTMFVWDAWAYIYAHQDAIPIEWLITCSDPTVTNLQEHIAGLWIDTGEYVHMDYRKRLGMESPLRIKDGWRQVLSGKRTIGDAESMCWTGTMAALPTAGTAAPGPDGWNDELLRIDSLLAVAEGPMLGVCLDWDSHWLAFGKVPVRPRNMIHYSRERFRASLKIWGDYYDQRPLGQTKSAAQAGGREDFGAVKGSSAVTLHDPYWLYEARYSISDFMRPFHYREVDGSRVLAADHPNWKTWSQGSWPKGPFKDTLGKVPNADNYIPEHSGSQWGGADDQHRSSNNFFALYALTGTYAMKSCLEDYLQVDLAQVPDRMGAARAVGRLFHTWSNMILLLDPPWNLSLNAHMSKRMDTTLEQWQGRTLIGKPIRVLELGSDPDLLDEEGKRILAWVVWQHGLLSTGLWAAWKVTMDDRYRDLVTIISEVVTKHGTFVQNGTQQSVAAIKYLLGPQEGNRLPEESYQIDSGDVRIPPWTFWIDVLPAMIIAKDLGSEEARTIIDKVSPNGPKTWQEAEAWAL